MSELNPNNTETVPIDGTGEIARYEVSTPSGGAPTIGLNIDGDDVASYAVDVGGSDSDDEATVWFNDEVTYTDVSSVSDGWVQAEEWVRIRVTSAATAGSEAVVYLARGE